MVNPPVTQIESSIRALTTAIQLVQPQHAATETPIPAKQGSYQALSKAYNHLAILLTQGLEAEKGARLQVVADTGSNTALASVSAFQEIEDLDKLPPIANFTLTQNPDRGPSTLSPLKVGGDQTKWKHLRTPPIPLRSMLILSRNQQRLIPGPVYLLSRFLSTNMHPIYSKLSFICRKTNGVVLTCSCDSCGCGVIAR